MKKSATLFLTIGLAVFVVGMFYANIVEICNIDTVSIKSESSILKIWGIMFLFSGIIVTKFNRYMLKNFKIITAVIAFVMSATFAMIVYSFLIQWSIWMFGTAGERPIANSASAFTLLLSVVLFVILLVLYYLVRKKKELKTDILIDIVIFFLYLIPFILTYLAIHGIVSNGLVLYYLSIP